jgi:tetratricopeptide (TPR) repeat protein
LPLSGKQYGTEEQAARFFKKGQYVQALPIYKEYTELYPDNPMYAYYYGVCLTETGHYGNKTRKILLKTALEDVPVNVFFYIAKNYHAINDFETALIYYQQFKEVSKKREQRKVKLRKIMKLCENYQNPFADENTGNFIAAYYQKSKTPDTKTEENNKPENLEKGPDKEAGNEKTPQNINKKAVTDRPEITNDDIEETKKPEKAEHLSSQESKEVIPEFPKDTIINFQLTSEIYYTKLSQFRNDTAKQYFAKAFFNQNKMNQIVDQTEKLRKDYDRTESPVYKKDIANEVIALEKKQLALKTAIEHDFLKARELEMKYWNDAPVEAFEQLKEENSQKLPSTSKDIVEKDITAIAETNDTVITETTDTVTQSLQEKEEAGTASTIAEEPESSTDEETETPGVVFKVQIGAYKSELPQTAKTLYDKISKLRKIEKYTDERGITIYTIGEMTDFEKAKKLQEQIRQESIKDAFIVAFKQGKRISLEEALENSEE